VKILGIESSCDESSIAIVEGNRAHINLIASQELHAYYGGVVPEFASREHMRLISSLVTDALQKSGTDLTEISGIAVTRGPGLMGALLVGLSFAKGLAYSLGVPLLGVNHVEGHIMVNFLDHPELQFPFLCLLVSGGHTQIVEVRDFGSYRILGRSVDDAAGEAFDKAARILQLPYPGGPAIDREARSGNPEFYSFPRARVKGKENHFSFSGLKTALLYLVRENGLDWARHHLADLCASYQEAIVDMLQDTAFRLLREEGWQQLVLAGGVAANSRLREVFSGEALRQNGRVYFPSLEYCTDNAAMIARTGAEMLKRGQTSPLSISALPNLSLETVPND